MHSETIISVVIPTLNRGEVLIQTIHLLFSQKALAKEIIVVDQTQYSHNDPTEQQLSDLNSNGKIHWCRLQQASIPNAMNIGLLTASGEYVLFIDDDVTFDESFLQEHLNGIKAHQAIAQVGQILQPWQESSAPNYGSRRKNLWQDLNFAYFSNEETEIYNCMAGNLCVHRETAIAAGGFDLHFSKVAYRFETEFCRRLIRFTNTPCQFVPKASLNHLKLSKGGTRAHSKNHLNVLSPDHSVGDYYFALRQFGHESSWSIIVYIFQRLFGSLVAKYYLTHPWYLPVRLCAEMWGLSWAMMKSLSPAKLITNNLKSD